MNTESKNWYERLNDDLERAFIVATKTDPRIIAAIRAVINRSIASGDSYDCFCARIAALNIPALRVRYSHQTIH